MDGKGGSNKKSASRIVLFIISVAFGALLSLAALISRGDSESSLARLIITVTFMLAGIYVQLILHEFGHFLFGRLTGYRLLLFRIGGFVFCRDEQDAVKVRRFRLPGVAGQCLMAPAGGTQAYALFHIGGVIVNALCAAVLLVGALLLPQGLWKANLILLAGITLLLAVTNGVPMKINGLPNDGYNLRLLRRDPQSRLAMENQLRYTEAILRGVRPREFPPAWFDIPEGYADDPLVCAMRYLRVGWILDRDGPDAGREEIDRLMAEDPPGLIPLQRQELLCERLFLELIGPAVPYTIGTLYTPALRTYMQQTRGMVTRMRQSAALAMLHERDAAKAAKCKADFEKAAPASPYRGEIPGERELLALAEARAAARAAPRYGPPAP